MSQAELESYERRLFLDSIFFGAWRRRRAAQALADDGSTDALRLLAKALSESEDRDVRSVAMQALEEAKGKSSDALGSAEWAVDPLVDALEDDNAKVRRQAQDFFDELQDGLLRSAVAPRLWQRWHETRSRALEAGAEACGCVADEPLRLKVVSALKLRERQVLTGMGEAVVKPLRDFCEDPDGTVAEQARAALAELTVPAAQEAVCALVVDEQDGVAKEAALEGGYAPEDERQRALFYLLTEQWDEYEALDHDYQRLQTAYDAADGTLRQTLREKLRASGRPSFVSAFTKGDLADRLASMQKDEVGFVAHQMITDGREEEVWRLAKKTSAMASVIALNALSESGWGPTKSTERQFFRKLSAKAEGLKDFEPSLVRLVKHDTPVEITADEEALLTPNGDYLIVFDRADGKTNEAGLRIVRVSDKKTLYHKQPSQPSSSSSSTVAERTEKVENRSMSHFVSQCGSYLLSAIPLPDEEDVDLLRLREIPSGEIVSNTSAPGGGCLSVYKAYRDHYCDSEPRYEGDEIMLVSRSLISDSLEVFPKGHNPTTGCYQFSKDGKRVLCVGSESARVLDVPSLSVISEFPVSEGALRIGMFREAEYVLLQTSQHFETRKIPEGTLISRMGYLPIRPSYPNPHYLTGEAEATPDGELLMFSGKPETSEQLSCRFLRRMYSLPTFDPVSSLDFRDEARTFIQTAFCPDGNYLSACMEQVVVDEGERNIKKHKDEYYLQSWSLPDLDKHLKTKLWGVEDRQSFAIPYSPIGPSKITLDPNNRFDVRKNSFECIHAGRVIATRFEERYYFDESGNREGVVAECKRGFVFHRAIDGESYAPDSETQQALVPEKESKDLKNDLQKHTINPSPETVQYWPSVFSSNGKTMLTLERKGESGSSIVETHDSRLPLTGTATLWNVLPLHLSCLPTAQMTREQIDLVDGLAHHQPDCQLSEEERSLFAIIAHKFEAHRRFDVEVESAASDSTTEVDIEIESAFHSS